ncbi:hypothetical protein G3I59_38315 [Amycolatopsis rubida]|uniref:Uncharacterized protein n=1 Tax=Amycolatopsis rubida TaxID=112413 RepID=A0ABX0C3X3_9PSEU|nr:hypothetical protein [Amycolatopsis rubida]NEC61304.1 hypothetical protein [Amycolatopsis rubida]OAP24162.1 hypothetical protein A4R44_04935 [Amycolatopsis sp. M39]
MKFEVDTHVIVTVRSTSGRSRYRISRSAIPRIRGLQSSVRTCGTDNAVSTR